MLYNLGEKRLEKYFNIIIGNIGAEENYIKEGLYLFISYFSTVSKVLVQNYLIVLLKYVLIGISDNSESISQIAYQTGQQIIKDHAMSNIDLFIENILKFMISSSWKYRESSLKLIEAFL